MDDNTNNHELRKLQSVQMEILNVIDRICKKNNLHYSLYAGTLLGAARHGGFIPWDDDLDICMSREDYDTFICLWDKEEHDGYLLQNKETNLGFTQSFTKIRKEHTTFLQYDWEVNKYHTGIFVDVFPVDRIPDGILRRTLFQWNVMKYQLFTREFVPPKATGLVMMISSFLLRTSSAEKRRKFRYKFEEKLRKYDKNKQYSVVMVERIDTSKQIMPKELLDSFAKLSFENAEYECFSLYREYLTRKYGDYMQLPPERNRVWNHNHLMIDFERDYEEILHG